MDKELKQVIQTLNRRIKQFEVHNYQETLQYKTLMASLNTIGVSLTVDKNGYTRIATAKKKDKLSEDQATRLQKIRKGNNTYAQAKKHGIEILKEWEKEGYTPSGNTKDEQIKSTLIDEGDLHEQIKNKAEMLYSLANVGIIEDVRGNNGRLSYHQVYAITHAEQLANEHYDEISQYEQQHNEKLKQMYNDEFAFYNDNVDPFEDNPFKQ